MASGGFTLLRSRANAFSGSVLYHYKHESTLCEVLHIRNDDAENACIFCVPTYPENSTGLPHILEHTVLCGTAKYRVKDLFKIMNEGSCNTMMNASTYPDRTLYPFASTVKEDVFHLMSAYADSVWFPLLEEGTFHQEGFHFLHTQSASSQNIKSAGVVYNEMKGAYSEHDAVIRDRIQRALFPHTIYRNDYGGDPAHIPTLRHEDLVAFHQRWYRPEYTKIILYGNIPTEEYLRFLDNDALSRWKEAPRAPYTPLGIHLPLSEPRRAVVPVSWAKDVPKRYSVDIAWALPLSTTDAFQCFVMVLFHAVTMGIPGAPLRRRLLESGLAEDISNIAGIELDLRQVLYDIGLVGIEEKTGQESDKAEKLIMRLLSEVLSEEGDKERIESALNSIEFRIKESLVSTGRKIQWMCTLARTWLYGGDVLEYADPIPFFERLKKEASDFRTLREYARTYLWENMHRCTVRSFPDYELSHRKEREEKQRLQSFFEKECASKRLCHWQKIEKWVRKHSAKEEEKKAVDAIPKLKISDLPRKVERWKELHRETPSGSSQWEAPVHFVKEGKDDIVYVWHHFDVTDIVRGNIESISMLPTLALCFTDLGTVDEPYQKIASRIRRVTGGLGASLEVIPTLDRSGKVYFSISASVIKEKIPLALDLIFDLFRSLAYHDTLRIEQIMNEEKVSIRSNIIYRGVNYAFFKAGQRYSALVETTDLLRGTAQLQHLIDAQADEAYARTLSKLAKKIFLRERLSHTVVSESSHSEDIDAFLKRFSSELPQGKEHVGSTQSYTVVKKDAHSTLPMRRAYTLPTHVASNVLVFPIPYSHSTDYAAYLMVSHIVSSKLWNAIRRRRGAYGAGCSALGRDGLMTLYSYRDPDIERSFETFCETIEETAEGKFSDADMEKHTVGIVGSDIAPRSPEEKGLSAHRRYISGMSDSIRQNIRNAIFELDKDAVVRAAEHCAKWSRAGSFVSLCSEKEIKKKDGNAQWAWDSIETLPQ